MLDTPHYYRQTAKGKGKGKAASKGAAGGGKKSALGLQIGEPAPDFALKNEVTSWVGSYTCGRTCGSFKNAFVLYTYI